MGNKKTLILVGIILAAFLVGVVWVGTKIPGGNQGNSQPEVAGARVEVSINPDDPVRGNPQAPVTIVEFSDFQCPACGAAEPAVREILASFKDQVRLVYKDFPLVTIHAKAFGAAEAALCARDQGKFWEYHDKLFENQTSLAPEDLKGYARQLDLDENQFDSCLTSRKNQKEVEKDMDEGRNLGVNSTPTFFVNGRKVVWQTENEGWFQALKKYLEEELRK